MRRGHLKGLRDVMVIPAEVCFMEPDVLFFVKSVLIRIPLYKPSVSFCYKFRTSGSELSRTNNASAIPRAQVLVESRLSRPSLEVKKLAKMGEISVGCALTVAPACHQS